MSIENSLFYAVDCWRINLWCKMVCAEKHSVYYLQQFLWKWSWQV